MKIYKTLSIVSIQFLFAIITLFLVYGIFERDLIITLLSFVARSCLQAMLIVDRKVWRDEE